MHLLERHFDIVLETEDGIPKLRGLILSLAMQGKLTFQNTKDQPTIELIREIEAEKSRLLTEGLTKNQAILPQLKQNEFPYEIPLSWEWIRLEDICTLITDGTHLTPKYISSGIPFLSVKNLSSGTINFSNTKFISKSEHSELSKRCKPEKGDILFTKVGTTGIAVEVNTEVEFSIFVSVALLKLVRDKVNSRFIELLLNSPLVKKYSKDGTEGVGNKNLVLWKIREYIIPLPPLAEQKRIVTKIDQLMSLCDTLEAERNERNSKRRAIHTAAVNNLLSAKNEKEFSSSWKFVTKNFDALYAVPENVADLKKAILQLAVMGKLVPQNPKDQPASELLKEIEAEKQRLVKDRKIKKQESMAPITPSEMPYELPKGWEWVRIGTIAQHNSGKTLDKGRNTGTYREYITTSNLNWGYFKLENLRQMPIREEELEKCSTRKGDLLICEGGEAGRAAVWDYSKSVCFQNHIHRIRFYGKIEAYYGFRYFEKLNSSGEINNYRKGVAISSMSSKVLASIVFPLPPLAEQKRIVAKIDELMRLCDRLEEQIEKSAEKQGEIINAVIAKVV